MATKFQTPYQLTDARTNGMEGHWRSLAVADARLGFRGYVLIACFVFFLYPISIDGLGVNYAFVLFPLGAVIATGRLRRPPNWLLFFIAFFAFIFFLASAYQYGFISEFPRRLVSFLIFMSIFSFAFIGIDPSAVRAFKIALVLSGLLFSLLAIKIFLGSGGAALGFEAKDIVGSQRYGFVYLFGFWLLLLSEYRSIFFRLFRYGALLVLAAGLMLTFSRSSIVGLAGSLSIFLFLSLWRRTDYSIIQFKRLFGIVFVLVLAYFLIAAYFPSTLEFFDVRLFDFISDREALEGNIADSSTSEGTRFFIWGHVLEYVLYNPLTGSGYLGVWVLDLFNTMSGSAHDQYMDVLFRVGIFGFVIYVLLLYKIARLLNRRHADLFWGFVAVAIYGFFHETFKETHGTFILAFLVGMLFQPIGHPTRPSIRRNAEGVTVRKPAVTL